ncbi:MAG TPA: hypothetical protein VHC63_17420 [Acidimicrobiales bacterium]|nr:hypothetical protein [Acidimicrobiales bacterium]
MKLTTILTGTALTAALALTPAAAMAQTGTGARRDATVDRVKTRCLAAIDRRQQAIVELNNRLDNRSNLQDAHRSALKQIDDQTSAGLTALANTIQGDTTGEQLRTDCRAIVDDYRVFVLVRPRARIVVTGDRELAAIDKLTDAAGRIQTAIDKQKADGKDTSKAEADLATMKSAIATASQHAGAVYDEVIHITPQTYTQGVLSAGRSDLQAGRDAVRSAAKAGHAAVADLKGSSSAA